MASQQVVEDPDREFRLFLIGLERAAHLRDLNLVVALFDTGNQLDLAKPCCDPYFVRHPLTASDLCSRRYSSGLR